MRFLNIGETIKKNDEVNVQLFGEWKPIWEKVTCFIGWKVTEGTYGKYRRRSPKKVKEVNDEAYRATKNSLIYRLW